MLHCPVLRPRPPGPFAIMKTAEFLFPRDLEVHPTELSRILLIGSCLSESYAAEFKKTHPGLEIENIIFGNAMQLPQKSAQELAAYDLQYVQLPLRNVLTDGVIRPQAGQDVDWVEVGKRNIDFLLEYGLAYAGQMLTVVSNFVVPQGRLAPSLADVDTDLDFVHVVRELNVYLARALRKRPHVYLADVDAIANSMGKKYFLDDTMYFFTHGVAAGLDQFIELEPEFSGSAPSRLEGNLHHVQRYPSDVGEYFEAVYRQIEAIHRTVNQTDSVKLVIFDLDNTMWRGLIGEHYEPGQSWPGMFGWPTGVWDAINQLRRRGIVVSLCSKNDERNVVEKWRHAMPLPFVEFSDFLVPKINWQPKAENVSAIMQALSLTAKNVVFVDDNPVERDAVKAAHPEIRTIGADPFAIKRILTWAPETQVARLSAESAGREASLLSKVKRDEERAAMPREEFLRQLETKLELVEIRDAQAPQFFRVQELVNKTNQFNTTAARRSLEDYQHHWAQGGRVFAFSVRDRYTDYGLVGVLFTLGNSITQYVMSCRVLGMEIELAVLREVGAVLRAADPSMPLSGLVIQTEKNTPSQGVFLAAGFQATNHPQFFVQTAPPAQPLAPHVQATWVQA
jgi:FkbH-like protein